MYSIGELRAGMAIILDGDPHIILSAQHAKQARQGGVAKTKVKNLVTGSVVAKTFQGNDKLEPAGLNNSTAQFLYSDGENFHFMDSSNYEQFQLDNESIDDQANYLVDGCDVNVLYFKGNPIAVTLPPKVVIEVEHTDPGVKGDTASGGSKPARLVTGYTVQVPLFINTGDLIRVNTESGEYVERA